MSNDLESEAGSQKSGVIRQRPQAQTSDFGLQTFDFLK
jgi:hypothetical protein